jgi:hypothetical protein
MRVVSRRNSSGTTWPASAHDAGRPSARGRRRARRRWGAASALILYLNATHGSFPVPLRGSIFWQQSAAINGQTIVDPLAVGPADRRGCLTTRGLTM